MMRYKAPDMSRYFEGVVIMHEPIQTMGLWRKNGIAGGKYLVQRRDGTVPEWPSFVLGARDPAAAFALRAYAVACEDQGRDPKYVDNVRELADEFDAYRRDHGDGDPDRSPHRTDDPEVVRKMAEGQGA